MSIEQNASFEGQRPTFTALPNWLRSMVTPSEGWLLWCLQSHYPNIYPSLNLLAQEAGMSRSMVAKVLSGLEAKGWLKRQPCFHSDGRQANTRYALTIWDIRWEIAASGLPVSGEPGELGGVHKVDGEGSTTWTVGAHHVDGGGPPRGHKEDQSKKINKNLNPRTPLNPPVRGEAPQAAPNGWASPDQLAQQPGQQPQAAQVPAAITSPSSSTLVVHPVEVLPPAGSASIDPAAAIWPLEPQQGASIAPAAHSPAEQPAGPSAGRTAPDPDRSGAETSKPRKPSKPRDPFSSRQLPPDSIPDNLLDCQQLLAEWWEVKSRGRTENAFRRACAFLSEQPPSDRRQILERAVIGGYQGLHPLPPQANRQQHGSGYSPLDTARRATEMISRMQAAMAEDGDNNPTTFFS